MLCGHVNKLLKDQNEVKEVVQESFCKTWAWLKQLEITGSYRLISIIQAQLQFIPKQEQKNE